jgi:predicted transcriptional regulator
VESTIRDRPGITRSELCRRLGLGWGTVGYHVLWLLRERRIYEARSRRRIFLYAATVGEERQLTMRLHWQDTPGRILRELQAAHARGLEDLVRSTGLSHRALRTSLQELVQAGLLERSASYHAKYRLSSPPLAAHATSHQAAIVLGDPSTMIGDP